MTPLDSIQLAIYGAIALVAGGYYLHCENVKADSEQFLERLRANAEEQEKRNAATIAEHEAQKESSNATAEKLRADLRIVSRRLHDERARSSLVPAASAATSRPDLACFDRAELAGALRIYEERVTGLLAEGDEDAVALRVARQWGVATRSHGSN